MARVPFFYAAVLVAVLLAGTGVEGAEPVTAGSRVRVEAPGVGEGVMIGTLHGARAEGLRLQLEGRTWAVEVPRAAIRGMWVSRGRGSKAALGAVLGLAAGAAVGYALHEDDDADPAVGDGRGLTIVFAAAGGAVVGGLAGSAMKHERWQAVDISSVRTSRRAPPAAIRVSLRF